ncbi:unnamed protein product [Dicrocoelium dendriticum]|nr:unnamed protein product [Dicrocoelium dendriticum]
MGRMHSKGKGNVSFSYRDSFGVAQVRWLAEDLYQLVKKAVSIRKHLGRNRKDKDNKYYKTCRMLPPNWKYDSSTASTLIA